MADIRKEQEREELHKAIWGIADDLRGSVDGWDFKQYVLGMMFYRYISENLTNYINAGEREAGDTEFDYAQLPDEEAEGGYVISCPDLIGCMSSGETIEEAVKNGEDARREWFIATLESGMEIPKH